MGGAFKGTSKDSKVEEGGEGQGYGSPFLNLFFTFKSKIHANEAAPESPDPTIIALNMARSTPKVTTLPSWKKCKSDIELRAIWVDSISWLRQRLLYVLSDSICS